MPLYTKEGSNLINYCDECDAHIVKDDQKFCDQCGNNLSMFCNVCLKPNPIQNRKIKNCGYCGNEFKPFGSPKS